MSERNRLDNVLRDFVRKRGKLHDNHGPMASGYVTCSECGGDWFDKDGDGKHRPGCAVPRLLELANRIGP